MKIFKSAVLTFYAFLIAVCLLVQPQVSYAALADVANKTVTYEDVGDAIIYTCTLAFSATDSTNDLTSQAINTYGLDFDKATIQLIADGETGADRNIFVRGGMSTDLTYIVSYQTRTEWDDYSADATNSASLFDLGVFEEVDFTLLSTTNDSALHYVPDQAVRCQYIVIEVDGQAGNTVYSGTNSIIVKIRVPKKPGYRRTSYVAESTT
jgi:hypothetical protein